MGNNCILSGVSGVVGGRGGRHYVESSGSDLMVFFSALLHARCDVPFSVAGVLLSSVLLWLWL